MTEYVCVRNVDNWSEINQITTTFSHLLHLLLKYFAFRYNYTKKKIRKFAYLLSILFPYKFIIHNKKAIMETECSRKMISATYFLYLPWISIFTPLKENIHSILKLRRVVNRYELPLNFQKLVAVVIGWRVGESCLLLLCGSVRMCCIACLEKCIRRMWNTFFVTIVCTWKPVDCGLFKRRNQFKFQTVSINVAFHAITLNDVLRSDLMLEEKLTSSICNL